MRESARYIFMYMTYRVSILNENGVETVFLEDLMTEVINNYPEVKDGWYEPSVGGNYYYNLKGGYSFGKNDITIVAGKIISQDFKTKPLFPIFTQIGYNIKF